VKTKLRGRVEVIHNGTDELTMRDEIFQPGELVNPYRVASSNELEENFNFSISENIFVDVDTKKLNNVLSSSRHTQVDENDNDEVNVEDCNEDEDESVDECVMP
jgi:hypothetical protein